MIDRYAWAGGHEAMLRFGARDAPTILVLPPLFEEANRMRAVIVGVMRRLADDFAIASILPDLPGTGDSTLLTVAARFEHWGAAVAALAKTLPQPRLTVAVRGGALLDGFADAAARWRLVPETGARLLRDMVRATALSSDETAADVGQRALAAPGRLAGHIIHPALFGALDRATPDAAIGIRTARFDDQGDVMIAGTPVWRRTEPGHDVNLERAMADDIAAWVRQCVAR